MLVAPSELGLFAVIGDYPLMVICPVIQRPQVETSHLFCFCLYLSEILDYVGTNGEWQCRPPLLLTFSQDLRETGSHMITKFLKKHLIRNKSRHGMGSLE